MRLSDLGDKRKCGLNLLEATAFGAQSRKLTREHLLWAGALAGTERPSWGGDPPATRACGSPPHFMGEQRRAHPGQGDGVTSQQQRRPRPSEGRLRTVGDGKGPHLDCGAVGIVALTSSEQAG